MNCPALKFGICKLLSRITYVGFGHDADGNELPLTGRQNFGIGLPESCHWRQAAFAAKPTLAMKNRTAARGTMLTVMNDC
jgi:hypothetical protein